jgi:hypothetical protein
MAKQSKRLEGRVKRLTDLRSEITTQRSQSKTHAKKFHELAGALRDKAPKRSS